MAETRTIRTVLELNAQRFNAGAASAAASAKSLSGELANISDAQGKHRADYDRVANSLLGVGAAAATGLGLAAKASMDWESAWAGVLKTVDGTDAELAQVEEGLRGLTKVLPASHQEIAAVAEAAGQLGVETGSVVEFTETMINLGETTNLSAEEAATSLARFANVMGTSQDDVDRLGSALVGLGNNFATTEGEILEMSMRLSGIGAQLNLSEGEVLGLATAMSSVGIEAQAGGTAMTMGMKKIDKAVREGGDALEGFAEVAGMSNEEFAKLWSEDSAAGLDAFVHGLSNVSEAGGDVSGTLDDLGIKGIRESDTFLRLASNADGLSEALERGNTEFERNVALAEEAGKRYETTASQLEIARNQLVDAGIDLGASILPVLADAAGHVADLASWFGELPGPVQSSVTALGAAAGASALLAGGLMKAVPAAMETVAAFKRIGQQSPATVTALGKVGRVAGTAAVGFVALQAAGGIADQFREATSSADEIAASLLNVADSGTITKESLDEMFSATGTGNAEVRDLAHALEILDAGAVAKAGDFLASGLGVWDTQTEVATQRVEELDRALSAMYTSGNAQAVADALEASGVPITDLIENLPTLKTELTKVATEMGLEADAATLAAIATGEIVPEAEDAAGAVDEFGNATGDATGEVEDQVSALDELQARLKTTSDLLLGVRGAERDFEAAIDDATAAVKENGKTLDTNTEKGRANEAALDGVADATFRWIDSMPDNATAEELDGILSRGREAFLETADAMEMPIEQAEELADQLGLIPQFVDVTVETEVDPEEKLPEFTGLLSDIPPETTTTVTAEADVEPALWEVNLLSAAVQDAGGTVTINGDTYGADEALDILMGIINSSDGTVTIDGFPVPAEEALGRAIALINSSGGTVDIEGDNSGANAATDSAKRKADGTTGTIDVDANTSGANSDIDNAARDRTSSIRVSVSYSDPGFSGAGMSQGFANGGWLNEGLNAGGWVPGPYPGQGVDNVLWPVQTGAAGGRSLAMQPLAGTEYVVNGQSAQQWGPALEAMNSGITPAQMAALVAPRASSNGLALTQNINGLTAYDVARESTTQMRHVVRAEAVPLA